MFVLRIHVTKLIFCFPGFRKNALPNTNMIQKENKLSVRAKKLTNKQKKNYDHVSDKYINNHTNKNLDEKTDRQERERNNDVRQKNVMP